MHSIKDLQDRFGLSYWKARKRLGLIGENFDGEVKGGQNSKYWITDNGLTILDRILELEDQKYDLNEAVDKVKKELNNKNETEETRKSKQTKVDPKYVEQLEKRLEDKEEKIEELRRDKKWIQEKYETLEQRLITGEVDENEEEKDEFKELGLVQVIKKWFTTKT